MFNLLQLEKCWGRLPLKTICMVRMDSFRSPLAPIQHWVAVEGVSEMLAHPVQSLLQNQSDWIILKSDISNALILSAEAT
jgi:hypothetical protein